MCPWANINRFQLSERAVPQPDLSLKPCTQQSSPNPQDSLSRATYTPNPEILCSPLLSLTLLWNWLYLFILRTLLTTFS